MSRKKRAVHVATITRTVNGKTYVTHLLRHTYREDGKVKHLTLGNLSDLPDDLIGLIRKRLAGEPLPQHGDDLQIVRSLPHGHVAAVLGTLRKIGLDRIVSAKSCREGQLITAMIVLRIIDPASKLAQLTSLQPDTAEHSLAGELGLAAIDTPEWYEALDWLRARQTRIENKLAKKHLSAGTLVLYDISSSYYTGRSSALLRHGYSRDGKPGEPQIVYGLLCAADEAFTYRRRDEQIAAEAALDGLYVVRTSVPAQTLSSQSAVRAYKDLSQVEWAFRSLKSVDLHVRPIYHWKDERIKSHVFLCMLAYYVEWHMRGLLAELLFDDHQRDAAEANRPSIVAPAPRSQAAKRKEQSRVTSDGYPVQSFQCLLKDLATLCKNRVRWDSCAELEFERITIPTRLQSRVFELLGVPFSK